MTSEDPAERPALRGVLMHALRSNLIPGLGLWAIATALVLLYFCVPAAQPFFSGISDARQRYGLYLSMLMGAVAAGILPWLICRCSGRARPWRDLVILTLWFTWRGVELDLFYALQAQLFSQSIAGLIGRVVVDQFIYSPLWVAPSTTLVMGWLGRGATRTALREVATFAYLRAHLPAMIIANWLIWIPAISLIYSLPTPLQLPVTMTVMVYWTLVAMLLSERQTQ